MRLVTAALILCFFAFTDLAAQAWDYPAFPRMDVKTDHLVAEISISDEGVITGELLYSMVAQRVTVDTIILDAVHIDVEEVRLNDNTVSFRAEGAQLLILPDEPFLRGDLLSLYIRYRAEPLFGLHLHDSGVIRTSQLPRSVRHWLPVVDHPGNGFTYEIAFIHPAGYDMIAGGRRLSSEIISVQQEKTVIRSEIALPVTTFGWITGQFPVQRSEITEDAYSVTFFSETDYYAIQELLDEAVALTGRLRNFSGVIPFDNLSIVLLDQHFLEVKQYMSGTVFLYREKGALLQQLRENLLAQWAGVYITEQNGSDPDAVFYLRALMALMAGLDPAGDTEHFHSDPVSSFSPADQSPYSAFSYPQFQRWMLTLDRDDSSEMLQNVMSVLPEIFGLGSRVMDWTHLTELVYLLTGQPHFHRLELSELATGSAFTQKSVDTGGFLYRAELEWEEGAETARVQFRAQGDAVPENVRVTVTEHSFFGKEEFETEFSGESSTVILSVSPAVENITFKVRGRDDISIEVVKPDLFWVYQLRNAESSDEKAEAARAMADSPENPDLQLALGDLLQFETDPLVVAELLRSISSLTMGASGTDERFIRYSAATQDPEIQLAAVEALANFRDNDRVADRLRTIAIQSNNREIRIAAIHSLSRVTDAARFSEIARNLVSREQLLEHIPLILTYLAEKGEIQLVGDIATYFLADEFPDRLRSDLIGVLMQADQDGSNWNRRIPGLMQNRNPIIRLRAAEALSLVPEAQREELRSQLLEREYDARVRTVLSSGADL